MVNQFTDPKLLRPKRLQVNLTHDEIERIRYASRLTDRTMAGFIRSAIRLYCDEVERVEYRLPPNVQMQKPHDESR